MQAFPRRVATCRRQHSARKRDLESRVHIDRFSYFRMFIYMIRSLLLNLWDVLRKTQLHFR